MANISDKVVQGGGTSDISETYVTVPPQTANYTVVNTTSTVVPVSSVSGPFNVTLPASVANNVRVRVHDLGNACGVFPVEVLDDQGSLVVKLNTDGGAVEVAYSETLSAWVTIDRFENMLDRDELTGEVSLRENTDTFVAGTLRAGVNPTSTVSKSDFTDLTQAATDQGTYVEGNPAIGSTTFNDPSVGLGFNTDNNTPYTVTASDGGADAYLILNGAVGSGNTWGVNIGDTITIDLGAVTSLSRLNYFSGNARVVTEMSIEYSVDGVGFTSLPNHTQPGMVTNSLSDDIPLNVDARFIRLGIVAHGSNFGEIAEVYIYPSALATFEARLASGTSGEFIPSTLTIRDSSNAVVNGAGKLNIAFAVDGAPLPVNGAGTTFNRYTIPQDQPGHTFFEHFKVTADEPFDVMVRKQTNGGDGTAFVDYGSSSENASSEVEIQQLIDSALDDYVGAGGSGDAITGTTDIVTGSLISSQDDGGTQTVHIFLKDDLLNRVALTGTFEIVVSTDNNVTVEANYSNEATDSGSTTFSATNPTSSGQVVVGGSSDYYDLEAFKALPDNIAFSSQFDVKIELLGTQSVSSLALSQPSTSSRMTKSGLLVEVEGQEVASLGTGGLVSPSGNFGQAGSVYDQRVSDGDFTNIGSNVDQQPNDFGNSSQLNANPVNEGNLSTDASTPFVITVSAERSGKEGWRAFDGNLNSGWQILDVTGSITVDYGAGNEKTIKGVQIGSDLEETDRTINAFRILGSNNGSTFVEIASLSQPFIPAIRTLGDAITFQNDVAYRYVRLVIDSNHGDGGLVGACEIRFFEGDFVSTDNTFDTRVVSGAFTLVPSTFQAYDELGTIISGPGLLNVDYSIDGAPYVAGPDQEDFKTLGNLQSTSSLDIRLKPIGDVRVSYFTISGPNQVLEVGSDGSATFKKDGVAYARLEINGLELPVHTNASRDAISAPATGAMVYNSDTNLVNIYNGTGWFALDMTAV